MGAGDAGAARLVSRRAWFPGRGLIMTHHKLGVALGLLLELLLLVLLQAADGGGEESAGDLGGHVGRVGRG